MKQDTLEVLQNLKTPVPESVFNKVADLQQTLPLLKHYIDLKNLIYGIRNGG